MSGKSKGKMQKTKTTVKTPNSKSKDKEQKNRTTDIKSNSKSNGNGQKTNTTVNTPNNNMDEKDLSGNDLKICLEKNEYEIKLNNNISSCDIDTNVHKKVINTIIFSVFIGAFYAWCSGSDTSNYILLLENKYAAFVIYLSPSIFYLIFLYSLCITVRNRRIKIDLELFANENNQRKIMTAFILSKLSIPEDDYSRMKAIYSLGDKYPNGVLFDNCEFYDYINKMTEKYLKYVGLNFSDNLRELIIRRHIIDKTIVKEKNDMYSYIVKNNNVFIIQAGLLAK
jgi:hypothetical protein